MISWYLTPNTEDNVSYLNNSTMKTVYLGNNSKGDVTREGPYGNVNSPIKIAYIIGVHPNESQSHQALYETIKEENGTLKKCYYIYRVNVTQNKYSYSSGRMNGQLLAQDFAVPDIKKENFSLVVDVHSNVGNWAETRFLFTPTTGSRSEEIAHLITDQLNWLKYYTPPNPTSTPYVTEPLNEAGIPAIIYETYVKDSYHVMKAHAYEFVKVVDGLSLI
jgi:hypothetical protein